MADEENRGKQGLRVLMSTSWGEGIAVKHDPEASNAWKDRTWDMLSAPSWKMSRSSSSSAALTPSSTMSLTTSSSALRSPSLPHNSIIILHRWRYAVKKSIIKSAIICLWDAVTPWWGASPWVNGAVGGGYGALG
jgi:predicted NAD/FAD-dependent oxidoreductase